MHRIYDICCSRFYVRVNTLILTIRIILCPGVAADCVERIWAATERENVEYRHAALRFACDLLGSASASSLVTCDHSARLLDLCLTSFESALSPAPVEEPESASTVIDSAVAEAALERRSRDLVLLRAGVDLLGLAWPSTPFEHDLWSACFLEFYSF